MKTKKKKPCADGYTIIVMGPHCWGKGATISIAKRNASRLYPTWEEKPKRFIAVLVPAKYDDCYVNQMGEVCWENGIAGQRTVGLGEI